MTAYNIINPGSMASGQPEDISVILANFQAIAAIINGQLDNSNLHPNASIPASKLQGYPSDAAKSLLGDGSWGVSAPSGAVMSFAGMAPPGGWLICDGSAISRTTYPTLYSIIGDTYGAGDGSTTFNIPDLRGRMSVGLGTTGDTTPLGKNDALAPLDRSPRHQHTVNDPTHTHVITVSGADDNNHAGNYGSQAADADAAPQASRVLDYSGTGITVGPAGYPTDTPAYIVLNFIIKV